MNIIKKTDPLEAFVIGNQARFYRLAYSYLQSRDDALDAVQTAVCRALEQRRRLRDPKALSAWFTRILVNVCMDILRQRQRFASVPPDDLDAGSYEDPLPADGTLTQRVNALPLEIQTVIKLRFYEEYSLREISEITGWNLSTVKNRLYGGLKKLRITMEGAAIE